MEFLVNLNVSSSITTLPRLLQLLLVAVSSFVNNYLFILLHLETLESRQKIQHDSR